MNSSDAVTPVEAQRRLELLQAELSSRESIVHFAHSAIALVVAMIFAGGSGKLCWDLPAENLYLGIPAVLLTLGLVLYSLVRYLRGKRVLAVELSRFELLKALRQDLNLDNPAALLPR